MTSSELRICAGVPVGDDAAEVQDVDAVADPEYETHVVVDEQQ